MTIRQDETILVIGEVLFDVFQDGTQVIGGAPFNVAWHLQAFQQAPFFISRVGCDPSGETILQAMRSWGMKEDGLQRDEFYPTGVVAVTLATGEPQYAILDHQAYDFIDAGQLPADSGSGLLYHGTLAVRHETSRRALQELKSRHRGGVFLDVNLREPWWLLQEVEDWLSQADWVKLNREEFGLLHGFGEDLKRDMSECLQRHALQGLIVTQGEQGACALLASGEWLSVGPALQTEVVDCVGAGDAFAAVLLLGLARDWELSLTLQRAQNFASALVGRRGATVQDRCFYQPFVDAWGL